MGRFATALVVVGLVSSMHGQASAATISRDYDIDTGETYWYVRDRDGERNRLAVNFNEERGLLTVREKGRARLSGSKRCDQQSARLVTCQGEPADNVYIDAGRGDDRVRCRGIVLAVGGGGGDDYLNVECTLYVFGASGSDHLVGGRYGEILVGGMGRDWIEGRGGEDLMFGDGDVNILYSHGDEISLFTDAKRGLYTTRRRHGADTFDGGRGTDRVSWLDHGRKSVRVDLAAGTGPEGDRLVAVENAVGGIGRDVLLGNRRANHLSGASGEDKLVGRGGNDIVSGGMSPDPYLYRDGDADVFSCGRGRDGVESVEFDVLPTSCELVAVAYPRGKSKFQPAFPRPAGRRRIEVPTYCASYLVKCSRRATISIAGRVVARSRRRTVEHGISWLAAPAERPLPRRRRLRIEITGRDIDNYDQHVPYAFEWRIKCAGPPACRPR